MADRNRKRGNQSNQDWDRNRGRYDRENDYNRESYGGDTGNYGNDYNRNRGMQGGYGETGYGGGTGTDYGNRGRENQYDRENDWNRSKQSNWGSSGSYGSDYNREQQNRNYGGSGGYGNMDNDYNRQRSRYGGDTSNFGNANQGGVDRDWWDRTSDEVSSWFGDDEAERRRRQDKQRMGQHRGKGPKGYTRSDDRILEDVCSRLSDDYSVDATDIDVKVENGEVTLTGTVSDREQKRRAEDLVESISGVQDVENRIKVKREGAAAHTTSQIASDLSGNTSADDWNKNKKV